MTGVKVNLSVMIDVENAETWGKAFNVTDEDEQRRIARKYAGLQFFNSMDDVLESLKDHCVPVEENGVKGYVHLCLYPKC